MQASDKGQTGGLWRATARTFTRTLQGHYQESLYSCGLAGMLWRSPSHQVFYRKPCPDRCAGLFLQFGPTSTKTSIPSRLKPPPSIAPGNKKRLDGRCFGWGRLGYRRAARSTAHRRECRPAFFHAARNPASLTQRSRPEPLKPLAPWPHLGRVRIVVHSA